MSPCPTCLTFLGCSKEHSDACPIQASLFCRRCHLKGHTATQCVEPHAFWERPTSLEELIPQDVRARWRITSHTSLSFTEPRGASKTESELPYEYVIHNEKKSLTKFMETEKISPVRREDGKKEDKIKTIRDWAMQKGYRIRLTQTAP
jgi:hypothetical protein